VIRIFFYMRQQIIYVFPAKQNYIMATFTCIWEIKICLKQTLSKLKTCLNQTDLTAPSSKCLCNLNLKLISIKTDKIGQQPENCENRNDPDFVQAFLKKWWVETDFKAPTLPLWTCIKIRKSTKMCDVKVFLTFTSLNLVLLWQLFCLFCSSIVINTVIVTAGTFEPHFCWLPYLYTCSLYENASFIIVSAETEYISTRSWYRNINCLRDRIRRIFL
jgi:hypothetical protein